MNYELRIKNWRLESNIY